MVLLYIETSQEQYVDQHTRAYPPPQLERGDEIRLPTPEPERFCYFCQGEIDEHHVCDDPDWHNGYC